jgi:hypothetical protein
LGRGHGLTVASPVAVYNIAGRDDKVRALEEINLADDSEFYPIKRCVPAACRTRGTQSWPGGKMRGRVGERDALVLGS